MMNKAQEEKLLARLLANTSTLKRSLPITKISSDVEKLIRHFGSIKIVSDKIGISTEMLNRFLAVKKLCPEVRNLVKKRKIDSVEVVNHLSFFSGTSQAVIANLIVEENLTSNDVKVLRAYRRSFPSLSIKEIVERVLKSKSKKIYIMYINIPIHIKPDLYLKRVKRIVGNKEIISFEHKQQIGKIKISKSGLHSLKKEAKGKKMNLRTYLNYITKEDN